MIKAVVFDLDDTLYNERDYVYSGFMEVSKYLNTKYGVDIDQLFLSMIDVLNENGRGNVFNVVCDQYGFDEQIEGLIDVYRNTLPNIKLYNDAIYILKKLKTKYYLGIITDGNSRTQWNKIKALHVNRYVDKIIVTDDIGEDYWKPSKVPYQEMLQFFAIEPKECIYIGDNPHKDFISAKQIGINTIRIIRKIGDHMNTFLPEEYEADFTIYSLEEVENVVDFINESL